MESEEFWENILETKTNIRKKMSEVIRTRIEQQALPYTTAMAAKDREREQRMIIVFSYYSYYFVCNCVGPSLGLQLHL